MRARVAAGTRQIVRSGSKRTRTLRNSVTGSNAASLPGGAWPGAALVSIHNAPGVDPHEGSHTAVAVGPQEQPLGKMRVRACPGQAGQLVAWAQAWPERAWAVEGATGLGICWPSSWSPPV